MANRARAVYALNHGVGLLHIIRHFFHRHILGLHAPLGLANSLTLSRLGASLKGVSLKAQVLILLLFSAIYFSQKSGASHRCLL
jgi:hypothetical protein